MEHSRIEWTDSTWNPVSGCTQVSPGCDHCYAKTIAASRIPHPRPAVHTRARSVAELRTPSGAA